MKFTTPLLTTSATKYQGARTIFRRGSAMPYVLGLLVCLGLLFSIWMRSIQSDNILSGKHLHRQQTALLAQSGLQYALARIAWPDTNQGSLRYQTPGLEHWLEPPRLGFHLEVKPKGLFSQVLSEGRWAATGGDTIHRKALWAEVGQMASPETFPALALLNTQGDLVLAGKSNIRGEVWLWRGSVRKKNHGKIRFTGGGHSGRVLDSASAPWELLELDLQRVDGWFEEQESLLAGKSSLAERGRSHIAGSTSNSGRARRTAGFGGGHAIRDTVMEGLSWMNSGKLVIGKGAVLRDTELRADSIVIEADARLEDVLVYARRRLVVTGMPELRGQFLARDSMVIDHAGRLSGYPFFYVHGHAEIKKGLSANAAANRPDTVFTGHMYLKQVRGEGVFVFGGWGRSTRHQQEHITVGQASDITGLVYALGWVNLSGKITGSLVCENLRFKHEETIYTGHLYNVSLNFASGGDERTVIPLPLIFKNIGDTQVQRRRWL